MCLHVAHHVLGFQSVWHKLPKLRNLDTKEWESEQSQKEWKHVLTPLQTEVNVTAVKTNLTLALPFIESLILSFSWVPVKEGVFIFPTWRLFQDDFLDVFKKSYMLHFSGHIIALDGNIFEDWDFSANCLVFAYVEVHNPLNCHIWRKLLKTVANSDF